MKANKTRCDGEWTESRFNSFIKSMLRKGSMRWKPKSTCKKEARWNEKLPNKKGRMVFHSICASCDAVTPETECAVDHIISVVPLSGFSTWDEIIERMFCEKEGLQVLCNTCHSVKTKHEREERKLAKE